jgi:hypothetical protein
VRETGLYTVSKPLSKLVAIVIFQVLVAGSLACAQPNYFVVRILQKAQGTAMPRSVADTAVGAAQTEPQMPPPEEPVRAENRPEAPNDPCLPALYKDWQEFANDVPEDGHRVRWPHVRIVIDRSSFTLALEGYAKKGEIHQLYRTTVALGDMDSPTPDGEFWINHIYAYPDVVFFPAAPQPPIAGLYNGFFAPLLTCDDRGRCQRHNDLGIHGYYPQASPQTASLRPITYGAASRGCIRLPDPCAFKAALIRSVGIGRLHINDRGAYHWLNKPVPVISAGYYPGTEFPTLVTIVEQGFQQFQNGLNYLWDGLVR